MRYFITDTIGSQGVLAIDFEGRDDDLEMLREWYTNGEGFAGDVTGAAEGAMDELFASLGVLDFSYDATAADFLGLNITEA